MPFGIARARRSVRAAAAVVLLALVLPTADASIEEVALPADARPLALAFAPDGKIWMTLDGPWAVGEFDPATENLTLHRLAAPPAPAASDEPGAPGDSLFALRRGPDGAWWTASQTNLHRVAPDGNATAFALPEPTFLAGDVAFADGKVLVALVTADAIAVFDPADGNWSLVPTPPRFGPLHFADEGGRLLVTGTYAGVVGVVDVAGGKVTVVSGGFSGPVGVAADEDVWVAEMGSSSVGRDASAGVEVGVDHFPTSPSPFYPSSGPSDVAVVDGKVWFVEHFADRIGLLDPVAGTLVEWMAPSAPGTNMQRIAVGPDGRVWFAEWSTSKLGWIDDDVAHTFPSLPQGVTVARGASVPVAVDTPVASTGSVVPGLTARATADGIVVNAAATTALGEHLLLVSKGTRPYLEGRYLTVTVTEAVPPPPAEAPGLALVAVLAAVALAARWRR